MLKYQRIGVLVVSALLAATCSSSRTQPLPSMPLSPTRPSVPEPAPPPPSDVWTITAQLTEAAGSSCVGDVMRSSQIGVSKTYTLSITPSYGGATVVFKDAAGSHECTFTGAASDTNGFSTVGRPGYFSCRAGEEMSTQCSDGQQRVLVPLGADISGQISGDHISGKWTFSWFDKDPFTYVESLQTTTEFTGSR